MIKYVSLIFILFSCTSLQVVDVELEKEYIGHFRDGNLDGIKACVAKNVAIDLKDEFGTNALLYASRRGNLEIVSFLLDNGADPNVTDRFGTSPLYFAEHGGEDESGYPAIITLLTSRGATYNTLHYKFIMACSRNDLASAQQYRAQGANINAQLPDGYSALMLAAEYGYLDIVKFLIRNNADRDIPSINDNSALYLAVDHNHVKVARYLIEAGANVNRFRTDGGGSILSCARRKGNKELIDLLVAKGAKEH